MDDNGIEKNTAPQHKGDAEIDYAAVAARPRLVATDPPVLRGEHLERPVTVAQHHRHHKKQNGGD